jgi:hypothetical protein
MPFYPRIHEEHWLRDRQEEGRIIILEDESVWEVHLADRQATARWLRMSSITVNDTRKQKEEYPYLMTNTTEGERVRANYLGKSSPRNSLSEFA